jgi:hypothetical protein
MLVKRRIRNPAGNCSCYSEITRPKGRRDKQSHLKYPLQCRILEDIIWFIELAYSRYHVTFTLTGADTVSEFWEWMSLIKVMNKIDRDIQLSGLYPRTSIWILISGTF